MLDAVASIVPETPPELFQLKLTGSVPEAVEPNPVPIVVQPVTRTTSSGSPNFTVGCVMSLLQFVRRVLKRCADRARQTFDIIFRAAKDTPRRLRFVSRPTCLPRRLGGMHR